MNIFRNRHLIWRPNFIQTIIFPLCGRSRDIRLEIYVRFQTSVICGTFYPRNMNASKFTYLYICCFYSIYFCNTYSSGCTLLFVQNLIIVFMFVVTTIVDKNIGTTTKNGVVKLFLKTIW